jgi:lantibiotic modifying enzyme
MNMKRLYDWLLRHREKHLLLARLEAAIDLSCDNYKLHRVDPVNVNVEPSVANETYISRSQFDSIMAELMDTYYGRIVWRDLKKNETIVEETLTAVIGSFDNPEFWKK